MTACVFLLDRTIFRPHDVVERHFGAALARPSRSRDEFQQRAADHEESINLMHERGDRGRRATGIIRPRWHCGHCRNEAPVRSS